MYRVVLDTNVILAAYLTKGAASKIVAKWAESSFDLVISEEIVKEYLRILLSQGIDPVLIGELNDQFKRYAILINPKKKLRIVKDDPDDDKFIECAVEGEVKYIVSNDKHLLKIKEFNGIEIISVQRFLSLF